MDCWALLPSSYHKISLCQWHREGLEGEMGNEGAIAPAGSTKQGRSPHSSVGVRAGFNVQLPCSSETAQRAQPHRVQSAPAGPCTARWQHGNPIPGSTSSPCARGWQGHQQQCQQQCPHLLPGRICRAA